MASAKDIKIDISASTGVHSGSDAIRYLLAGADSVQVCSVLYDKGIAFLKQMNGQIINWMDRNKFESNNEFKGRLNYKNYSKPFLFERTQFIQNLASHE